MLNSNLKNKILASASSIALLAQAVATPAFALSAGATNDTTGADSTNHTQVEVVQDTVLVQDNSAKIDNDINFKVNTGDNSANKNNGTGHIETGDAVLGVSVSNQANSNVADVSACGGCDLDAIAGNVKTGADSENKAAIQYEKNNQLFQNNRAYIDNDVNLKANTGENRANKNNDGGYVATGDVVATTVVDNAANQNLATMAAGSQQGTNLATAVNNTTGADSTNYARIRASFDNVVDQSNWANIDNDVELKLNTGKNSANKNNGWAGGHIETGDIDTGVGLNNTANHNFAVLDSACCDIELDTANHKTGADSDNRTEVLLANRMQAFQTNCGYEQGLSLLSLFRNGDCSIDNDVDGYANTGHNATNKNNSDDVITGVVDAYVQVESDTNENVYGDAMTSGIGDIEFPSQDYNGWWMMFMGLLNS